jgi:hypothetical protein
MRATLGDMHRITTVAFVTLLVVALARIAATYSVFNHAYDENAHIGAGMEWLDKGTYQYEPMHPPMRAVYALGPHLFGIGAFGEAHWGEEGQRILYADGQYWRNLTAARVAALPFFAITLLFVFLWARRIGGSLAAVLATLAYSTLPLALAHAGLVGNDTLLACTLMVALYAWARWLEAPDWRRAVVLGLAMGAMALSKFSGPLFFFAVMASTGALWLARLPVVGGGSVPDVRSRLRHASLALVIAGAVSFAVVWAGYRFSVGPVIESGEALNRLVGETGVLHDVATAVARAMPAPEFWNGLEMLVRYNRAPQLSYLMGEISEQGFAAFFPVGILVKTPIAFLVLMLGGLVLLLGRSWRSNNPFVFLAPFAPILIVLVLMPAGLNLGVRHVLPAFPMLAVCAGVFAAWLWRAGAGRAQVAGRLLLTGLVAWLVVAGVRAHPDYLAYFNECCERSPEYWLVNSDLDWGQDLQRLSDELRERSIDQIHIAYFGMPELHQHGLPSYELLLPSERVKGWVAVSEYNLVFGTLEPPYDQYRWLLDYEPVARVGKSIRLYWIP